MQDDRTVITPLSGRVRQQFSRARSRIVREVTAGVRSGISSLEVGASPTAKDLASRWDQAVLQGVRPAHSLGAAAVRVVDLFCGGGGLALGMREAANALGADLLVTAAADANPEVLQVHARNLSPRRTLNTNLWQAISPNIARRGTESVFRSRPKLLLEGLADLVGRTDVVIGGPPCEGHSNFNNHSRRDDPRNLLYLVMPSMAVALGSTAVVIENVPSVVHDRSGVVETAVRLLESEGYHVDHDVLNLGELGAAQNRKRHLLIASRTSRPSLRDAATCLRAPERPIEWAIGDLVDARETALDKPAVLSRENQRRVDYLFKENLHDLPNKKRPKCHRGGDHSYTAVYGRLHWDRPAPTITTGFRSPGQGRYVHPCRPRTLTPHEAARLQGFPDTFDFRLTHGGFPSSHDLAHLIGDAVPPKLGYAAGLCVLATL